MKNIFITVIGLLLSASLLQAQTDTMYVMKAGVVINKQSIKLADVDSIIFYNPMINTVTDIDGNVYKTIKIGTQTWMADNLKTTKYNDGTAIPIVTDNTAWKNLSAPAYCWYNNDATTNNTYGALYNWYTVNTAKLAPAGWHVPTDAEWTILENYLMANGYNYDVTTSGNKYAKSLAVSNVGWSPSKSTGAVGNEDYPTKFNTTGFSALPSGNRSSNGTFYYAGFTCGWWSTTETGATFAWNRWLYYDYSSVKNSGSNEKVNGFSVRCLKD
jgi:uncharacterized protein (TIGR02145 family)